MYVLIYVYATGLWLFGFKSSSFLHVKTLSQFFVSSIQSLYPGYHYKSPGVQNYVVVINVKFPNISFVKTLPFFCRKKLKSFFSAKVPIIFFFCKRYKHN